MKREEIKEYRKGFTTEQLDEMAELYDAGEKVINIIKKCNLKISAGQISYFLPTVETDKICPYCNLPMRRRRKRDLYYYSDDIRCEECGHYYDNWYKECECINCQKKKIQLVEWKKERVKSYYSEIIPLEKIEYGELEFRQRCLLFFLYCIIEKLLNFDYISHKVIKDIMALDLVKQLIKEGILYVSPNSDIDAFLDEDFPSKYYVEKVDYIVNVSFSEKDKKALSKKDFVLDGVLESEIKEVIYELMYQDLLAEFKKLLAERNIGFEPSVKQLKDFRNLLNEGSYTQIRYMCYKVALFYNDGITTGRLYRKKVPQQVLASVATFFHNNMSKYGDVYRSDAEYVGKLLRIFIEDVLGKEVYILNEVI